MVAPTKEQWKLQSELVPILNKYKETMEFDEILTILGAIIGNAIRQVEDEKVRALAISLVVDSMHHTIQTDYEVKEPNA